jgi:hypothetical protein
MRNLIISLVIITLGSFSLSAQDWELDGNISINPTVDFLGTTDNTPIPFRTSNTERMRLWPTGLQTIGTGSQVYTIDQGGMLGIGQEFNFFSGGAAVGPYSLIHLIGLNTC